MARPALKITKLVPEATVPRYATEGSAGMDLSSVAEVLIEPGRWGLVPTGLALEIPAGSEGQVRPRSGLAVKRGVTVLNAPGTIDSDYRGEVKVALINHSADPFSVLPGDRIAQLVICPVTQVEMELSEELGETGRGSGGFGSTGR